MASLEGCVKHLGDDALCGDASGAGLSDNERQFVRAIPEASNASADELVNHVVSYFDHPRIPLTALLLFPSLAHRFARWFLRDAVICPFDTGDGRVGLAVADPTDCFSSRAGEIALRTPMSIHVASFEDVAVALSERLGPDEETPALARPKWRKSASTLARSRQWRACRAGRQRSSRKSDRSQGQRLRPCSPSTRSLDRRFR